jgi:hypothetical protein
VKTERWAWGGTREVRLVSTAKRPAVADTPEALFPYFQR